MLHFSDQIIFLLCLSKRINKILKDLSPYLKYSVEKSEWLGTLYCGDEIMTVYYYNTNNEAKEIIKKLSNSLHKWIQPNLPEDLCFLKEGEGWLINTAHEYLSYINTKNKEEYIKIINMGLDVSLDENEKELFKV